jgi:DNA-3-methyladenine glycosylase II
MFTINEDIGPFCYEMHKDPIMASLIRQLPGVKIPTTATLFEALVDSVVEQQISLKAAHSIEKRLIRETGRTREVHDQTAIVTRHRKPWLRHQTEPSGPAA